MANPMPSSPPVNDPLVPRDFGGWFERALAVFGDNFTRLLPFALAEAASTVLCAAAVYVGLPHVRPLLNQLAVGVEPDAAQLLQLISTWVLPVGLAYLGLLVVTGAVRQCAGYFLVAAQANGQPCTLGDALRFGLDRLVPYVGWTALGWLISLLAVAVPVAAGLATGNGVLIALGCLVAVPLAGYFGVVFSASLSGVVAVERAGIDRCVELVKGRFWATAARVMTVWGLSGAYASLVNQLLVVLFRRALSTGGSSAPGPFGIDGSSLMVTVVIYAAASVPLSVLTVATSLVTYTELRFRQDPEFTTATLAGELAVRP